MSFTSVIDASDSSSISAIEGIIVCSSVTGNDNIFKFPRCSCMALCSVALESEAMVWASLYFLYSLFSSSDIGVGLFPTIASYSFCCSSSFYENNNKIRNNKDIELDKKRWIDGADVNYLNLKWLIKLYEGCRFFDCCLLYLKYLTMHSLTYGPGSASF